MFEKIRQNSDLIWEDEEMEVLQLKESLPELGLEKNDLIGLFKLEKEVRRFPFKDEGLKQAVIDILIGIETSEEEYEKVMRRLEEKNVSSQEA